MKMMTGRFFRAASRRLLKRATTCWYVSPSIDSSGWRRSSIWAVTSLSRERMLVELGVAPINRSTTFASGWAARASSAAWAISELLLAPGEPESTNGWRTGDSR